MTETIVKVPQCTDADYDFIAFSFKGKHSLEDFGIYRVGDGNRYNDNILPPINDRTAENNGDGQFYFGSTHKPKVFNISFAFDDMSEQKYREMRQWLNGKEMGDLWFAETPYKVYTAKVTGQPLMKTVCFEEGGQRVYKGEGSVQFTAFWPYAHTPDYVSNDTIFIYNNISDKIEIIDQPTLRYLCVEFIGEKPEGTLLLQYHGTKTRDNTSWNPNPTLSNGVYKLRESIKISSIELKDDSEIQSCKIRMYSCDENGNHRQILRRSAIELPANTEYAWQLFPNYNQWKDSITLPQANKNNGDVPAPFVAKLGNVRNDTTDETATYVFEILEQENSEEAHIMGITLRSGFDGIVSPASDISSYAITEVSGMSKEQQLKEVDFSNLEFVTTLANETFSGCSGLIKMVLPENLQTIGEKCFYNCRSLSDINIPSTVSEIGTYTFYNCQKLNTILIPDGISVIGKYCFYSCGFNTVEFGEDSGLIEFQTYAFQKSKISEIIIPNNVTKIGAYAFSYTKNLSKVIMSQSIESIGKRAFYYNGDNPNKNEKLVLDFSNANDVPDLVSADAIVYNNYCKSIIIVPDNLYEKWINATNWSGLTDHIVAKSEYTG